METLLSRLGLCAVLAIGTVTTCAVAPDPLRVLLVTGGHDFERDPFLDVFKRDYLHPAAGSDASKTGAGLFVKPAV
jgi:hypothetical protein